MLNNEMIEKCCELIGWDLTRDGTLKMDGAFLCDIETEAFVRLYYPLMLQLTIEAIEDGTNEHLVILGRFGKYSINIYEDRECLTFAPFQFETKLEAKEFFITEYFNSHKEVPEVDTINQAAVKLLQGMIEKLEDKNKRVPVPMAKEALETLGKKLC